MSLSSDVFSYGMLLYEIFAYKLPFPDAKTDAEVISKIMKGEVRGTTDVLRNKQASLVVLIVLVNYICNGTLLHYVIILPPYQVPLIPDCTDPDVATLMSLCWATDPKVGLMTYNS